MSNDIPISEQGQRKIRRPYDHQSREPRRKFLRFLIRVIGFNFLAKIDSVKGLDHIPVSGPAVLLINHIAFIDPIAVIHVLPRNIIPMAKIEVYDLPVIGIFPRMWDVIPVRREEIDRQALKTANEILKAGEIILIAPEATRSPQLQLGKVGIAYIASRAGVPVVPVAIEGTPGFPTFPFSRRFRGPGVSIHFGKPFRYKPAFKRADRTQLRKMTDEAMYVLAGLLPVERRGVYHDLSEATQETIEFLPV